MVKRTKKVTKVASDAAVQDKNNKKETTQKKSVRSKTEKQHKKVVPFIAMAVLIGLFLISIVMILRESKHSADAIILHDLQKLHAIFESIDQDCKIIDFEHTQNYIDFLTVKEFVGSEVGAMNLSYPRNWKGPYVKDNPTVHEQQYIVLKNKSGYYLVPGDGVKLANGKVVGKDFVLNEKSDMEKLLQDTEALKTSEGSLGIKLPIGGSYIKQVLQAPLRYL